MSWEYGEETVESGEGTQEGEEGKDVVAAIGKFQASLAKLMKFHENPLPTLCEQVVHLACWMYVILGSFALQTCSGTHEPYWIPLLVR